jgi:hypothetical protein
MVEEGARVWIQGYVDEWYQNAQLHWDEGMGGFKFVHPNYGAC